MVSCCRSWTALLVGATGLAAAIPLPAQTQQPPQPRFESATVVANNSDSRFNQGARITQNQLSAKNVTLKALIEAAYDVQAPQVLGGPHWLDDDTYDVSTSAAPGTNEEQMWAMLRTLLADRFQLRVQSDTKDLPYYELVEGAKGGRGLGSAFPACGHGATQVSVENRGYGQEGTIVMSATVEQLADALSVATQRIVVSRTPMTGVYCFALWWGPDANPTIEGGGGYPADPATQTANGHPDVARPVAGSVFQAVHRAGLGLVKSMGPIEMLVVQGAEKAK